MRRNSIITILTVVLLIAGLAVLLYPYASNLLSSRNQEEEIRTYVTVVSSMEEDECERILQEAQEYNEALAAKPQLGELSDEEFGRYRDTLRLTGSGVIGYIEIPSIDVSLPIYHGTDDYVLQIGVGHVNWTSLPVGGPDTHAVLSGHRGLPSSRLFTHLDRVAVGDIFTIQVLNQTLTYEVDRILTVLPEETEPLQIVSGEDLCTLVTCTPYGINTHRLLVRGHRIENPSEPEPVEEPQPEQEEQITLFDTKTLYIIAVVCATVVILFITGLILLAVNRRREKRKKRFQHSDPRKNGGAAFEKENEN